jgi:phosphoribosyl-ATP pyrophosphohydrolase/phosphoribosyl-AMP cyclohydrolase
MDINYDTNGLVPAIIQDKNTKTVLMLGYMNADALQHTLNTGKVTFYSRSKKRLWTKGEESGHFLLLHSIQNDCDSDSLLVQVEPQGPTCHKGTDNCWGDSNTQHYGFLSELEHIIKDRKTNSTSKTSYISSLFEKGLNTIAQKVGEEAIEVVIEAKDHNDDLFLNESADLLFHYLVLLHAKGFDIQSVIEILKSRH